MEGWFDWQAARSTQAEWPLPVVLLSACFSPPLSHTHSHTHSRTHSHTHTRTRTRTRYSGTTVFRVSPMIAALLESLRTPVSEGESPTQAPTHTHTHTHSHSRCSGANLAVLSSEGSLLLFSLRSDLVASTLQLPEHEVVCLRYHPHSLCHSLTHSLCHSLTHSPHALLVL
jgi:hypothetical protein